MGGGITMEDEYVLSPSQNLNVETLPWEEEDLHTVEGPREAQGSPWELFSEEYAHPEKWLDFLSTTAKNAGALAKGGIKGTLGIPGNLQTLANLGAEKIGLLSPEFAEKERETHLGSSKIGELLGFGEPEDATERYLDRIGGTAGPALLMSLLSGGTIPPHIAAAILSGAVGQSLEELGFGPVAQFFGEMATSPLASRMTPNTQITSKIPKVQKTVSTMKNLGASKEAQLLHKQAGEGKLRLAKTAGASGKNTAAFENAFKETEKALDTYVTHNIEGLAKGEKYLDRHVDTLFNKLHKEANQVPITNNKPLVDTLERIRDEASSGLGPSAQQKEIIKMYNEKIDNARNGLNAKGNPATAGDLIDEMHNANSDFSSYENKTQKRQAMREYKDGLKKTIAAQGPEGKRIAEQTEQVFDHYVKYLDKKEALSKLKDLGYGTENINWRRLDKSLDNTDNIELFTSAMGKDAVADLKVLSQGAEKLKKLQSVMESGPVKVLLEKSGLVSAGSALVSFLSGGTIPVSPWAAVPYVGYLGVKTGAGKMLTDPKWQHAGANTIRAIGSGSPERIASALQKWDELLKEDREIQKDKDSPEEEFTLRQN